MFNFSLFCRSRKKVCQILSKLISLLVVATAFMLSVIPLVLLCGKSNLIYSQCVFFSSSILFVLFLLSIGTRITFEGALPKTLGNYYYEIYLTQGIAYSLTY